MKIKKTSLMGTLLAFVMVAGVSAGALAVSFDGSSPAGVPPEDSEKIMPKLISVTADPAGNPGKDEAYRFKFPWDSISLEEYDAVLSRYDQTRPYYTREQLAQFYENGWPQYFDVDTRQMHIQPELPPLAEYIEPVVLRPVRGRPNPDLWPCDNNYYIIVEGQRVCTSCGYIFTEEENEEIGWSRQ